MQKKTPSSYALLSVFDKTNLFDLAQALTKVGIKIIASGGTAAFLQKHKIPLIPIELITHSPESFEGRVKTISFQIASGILFDRTKPSHQKEAQTLAIPTIDYVICNFYPFWEKPSMELIDVGGPTMVRAAAKNHESVTVLVDPADYAPVIAELAENKQTTKDSRLGLAAKAFQYVTDYDAQISNWFGKDNAFAIVMSNGKKLRYGENPHQTAHVYEDKNQQQDPLGFAKFTVLQGKEPSFNNLLDLHAAIETISLIGKKDPSCVIIKHNNPCGAATASTTEEAFAHAWNGDPLAAFGGIIALNRPVSKKLAENMLKDKRFFEVLAAPTFAADALSVFVQKPKLQLYTNQALQKPHLVSYNDIKTIRGGFLVQDGNIHELSKKDITVVTKKKPTQQQIDDMLFAWAICQVSKSNCVVAVKNQTLLASGVGQQDRKRCCELCVSKASRALTDAVAATDGFFPFADGPEVLINAGITAIIQPGGSIRDQDTIDLCNKRGIIMATTGIRTFKH